MTYYIEFHEIGCGFHVDAESGPEAISKARALVIAALDAEIAQGSVRCDLLMKVYEQ